MKYKTLTLQKGKEKALQRRHPWVFSGAFKNISPDIETGTLVQVEDSHGNFRALGFFNKGSIAVRILSFDPVDNIEELIRQKIENAIHYRRSLGFFDNALTNCYRLVFAEGDGLSGLVIDKYADTAVIQIHHIGWAVYLPFIARLLTQLGIVKHVFSKPTDKIKLDDEYKGSLIGQATGTPVLEHGHLFKVDWQTGQKTGFFIDQRENRKRLADFSKGRSILNTFSYTGGFSIYALKAGASRAVSVDISQPAVALAHSNAELNDAADRHEGVASDVFEFLKHEGSQFDIIVLDPPAFAKNRRSAHNAVQGYKRLNLLAMNQIKKGGFIFTFSCSQHIDNRLFEDTIRAAAIECGRQVRLVERLIQPADHPVNIYHPEGEYLKGLILAIN